MDDTSNSGKPFFVVWSLIAIPTVTVLISNLGDTIVGYLKNGLLWVGERTLLRDRKHRHDNATSPDGKEKATNEDQNQPANESNSVVGLGGDMATFGEATEEQDQRGHASSLTSRIAREVSRLARDVGAMPGVQYEWSDWVEWLDMLDMQCILRPGDERSQPENVAQEWTWLADDGPLFSCVSETEWILGKLCSRLELVLEQELKDARRSSDIE
ncbi:hypothetical protein H0H87_009259 [Tephrocybe sp. NHM501043]|nr:hypothetical protein H0H87_009259 [Tephrocybe sp. NHM501043]